jgi:MGT family glycosyltransferase
MDPSPYPDTRRYREVWPAARELPDWWGGSTDPLVYVSFGTVTGTVGDGVYRMAVQALADLPVRVLMSTGQDLHLHSVPENVRVCEWVDQQDALAAASVVLCHGGSGTTLGALAAGVPMVIMALFADQFRNAAALAGLGVAVVLDAARSSAADRAAYDPSAVSALRDAVQRVLRDGALRANAARVAAGLDGRATPADLLAGLAR